MYISQKHKLSEVRRHDMWLKATKSFLSPIDREWPHSFVSWLLSCLLNAVCCPLGSDLRSLCSATMTALLVGSSAAHQKSLWGRDGGRFDLDRRQRGNRWAVCVWHPWGIPHLPAGHTAPVSCPAPSFVPTQTPWRLVGHSGTTRILLPGSSLSLSAALSSRPCLEIRYRKFAWIFQTSPSVCLVSLCLSLITLHSVRYRFISLPLVLSAEKSITAPESSLKEVNFYTVFFRSAMSWMEPL